VPDAISIDNPKLRIGDDLEWAERSEYWRAHEPAGRRGRRRKFKYREPLIICGHGARIRVDRGTLLIRNGFTHFPQKSEEIRYFPGDPNLPNRIIILDGSGGISFDALDWMSEQKIEFVRLDWRGRATSIGGNSGYAANPKLVQVQWEIQGTKRQLEIARWLVAEKLEASIATLNELFPKSEIRENVIARLKSDILEIRKSRKSISLSRVFGIEGRCAVAYFKVWHGLPLKWRGTGRKPIPNDWLEIVPRNMAWRKRARAARHPLNAMLNYGYGILANEVRSQAIAAGLDPTIGIIHGNSENPIPLVYDLMEPLRPTVDQRVLGFALSLEFTPGDFTISKWGGCRLNPQLAGALVKSIAGVLDVAPAVRSFVRALVG